MEIHDAISKARGNDDVKNLRGYFLGSCFACIKTNEDEVNDWTLMYYDPKKGAAIDCFVSEKYVTVSKETRPVNPVKEIDTADLKVSLGKALAAASKKFGKKTINILITLHEKSGLTWTLNMIGADLSVTSYDISAKDGTITGEESTSLVRKL